MAWDQLLGFFSPEAGQARRQWLNRQEANVGNALRHYLGPAAQPIQSAAMLAGYMSPGADMMEAADASRGMWNADNPLDAAVAGATMLGATGMMFLPGNYNALREGIGSVADDMAAAYDPSRVNSIIAYHGTKRPIDMPTVDGGGGRLWFSSDEDYSAGLAGRINRSRQDSGTLFQAQLNIKNPYEVDAARESRDTMAQVLDDETLSAMTPAEIEDAWRGGQNFESILDYYQDEALANGHDAVVFRNTLDGFDRMTDQYVIFDDSLIDILKRYGIGAAAAGGGWALAPEEAQAAGQVLDPQSRDRQQILDWLDSQGL